MIKYFLFIFALVSIGFAFYSIDMVRIIASLVGSPIGVILIGFLASLILFMKKNTITIVILLLIITILFVWAGVFISK